MFLKKHIAECKFLIFFAFVMILISQSSTGEEKTASSKKKFVSPRAARSFVELQHSITSPKFHIASATEIQGNIAVVQADPELLILSNSFDLGNRALHFQPVLQGRYTYAPVFLNFDGTATQALPLADDASAEVVFKNFVFPFGRKTYDRCYVNSNGNVTFARSDIDPPNADNITGGPPRIAAFFADLDPESSGTVFVNQTTDRVVISWLRIPEFFNQNQFDFGQNTFQIVLHNDGGVDLVFEDLTATQGIVGIITGPNLPLHLVDFSKADSANHPLRSFVENFHDYESIDIPLLMKSLYQDIPDKFDFVTLMSNFNLTPVPGAQAFAINVRNNVKGIGNPNSDGSAIFHGNDRFGSSRRLQNITFLGNIHDYPVDLNDPLADTDTSTLAILAHEVAHRWLTYVKFLRDGKKSNELIGRDLSHWSFFFNSNASFLEGNQILQSTSNSFTTDTPFRRYSPLDLYLMGMIGPSEVPDSFYVDGPSDFSPEFEFSKDSAPESNVHFKGVPIRVSISDIIAANGVRKPAVATSQKEFRHLFVLIVKNDAPASTEELGRIDLLRVSWEQFFSAATGKRAHIDTSIR